MFTNFVHFVESLFQPFLAFFSFLPSDFRYLFLSAIAFLVAVALKRSVTQ